MKKIALLALAAWLLAAAAPAQDFAREKLDNWHQWRGPDANGTAPKGDPPVTWDEKTHVKWKAALPGRGSATPVVWGDRVFVLTAVETDRVAADAALPVGDPHFEKKTVAPRKFYQFVVLCFDRGTGQVRWRQLATEQVPHEGHHPTHSYAAGSPATDGHYLYASFGSRGVYCYDLDGNPRWHRDLGRLNTRLGWGEAVTPVVHGDALLLNWDQEADSALLCLNARDGTTRWRADHDEKTSWNTPLVVAYRGRTQVVVSGTTRIRSYDLETGRLLWQCGGMTVNPIPSAVAGDGVVYCMSGYKGAAALAISLDAQGDVTGTDKVLWRHGQGTPYVPSPLLLGDRLYFTQTNDPLLTVLDAKSGKAVLDRERLPGLGTLYASPVAAAGRVYLVDREGTALVLKAGDQLEVLATNRLDDALDASPAVAGKQLFLRGQQHLYCLEAD